MANKDTHKKKDNRKAGRNKVKCAKYRVEGRREINKARRMKRHLKRYPSR